MASALSLSSRAPLQARTILLRREQGEPSAQGGLMAVLGLHRPCPQGCLAERAGSLQDSSSAGEWSCPVGLA